MLNDEQLEAVNSKSHTSVIAIPGSGKTTLTIHKIDKILSRSSSNKVLAVVFNALAAEEMKLRASKNGVDVRRLQSGTYHALALSQLRNSGYSPNIVSSDKQRALVSKAMNETGIDDFMITQALIEEHKTSIDRFIDPNQYARTHGDCPGYAAFKIYQQGLSKRKLIDFSDILLLVVQGMEDGDIAPLSATHIIADEFQDIDPLQLKWLCHQVDLNSAILTVVGDDDQTIYGFRSALGYDAFLEIEKLYKPEQVCLVSNYRTREEILSKAKLLIDNNIQRIPKSMDAATGPGGVIEIYECIDAEHEIQNIYEFLCGVEGSTAVLARNNFALKILQSSLMEYGFVDFAMTKTVSVFDFPLPALAMNCMSAIYNDDPNIIEDVLSGFYIPDSDVESIYALLTKSSSTPTASLDKSSIELVTRLQLLVKQHRSDRTQQGVNEAIDAVEALIMNSFPMDFLADVEVSMRQLNQALSLMRKFQGTWDQRKYALQEKTAKEAPVLLSTFHGSKGLEFDNVWIMGATLSGIPPSKQDFDIEEERRLFYVAITRAKTRLAISHVGCQSVFLDEMNIGQQKEKRFGSSN